VADLGLEGDAQLGRLGVERVVGAIGGRLPPHEGLDAERHEAAVAHVVLELADGLHDVDGARVVLAEDAPGWRSCAFATAPLSPAMSAVRTPARSMASIIFARSVPWWKTSSMP